MDLTKRENGQPKEGYNNMGRRRQQLQAENEYYHHQAHRQKARTSRLDERLMNQSSQPKQSQRNFYQQDQVSSQTQAPDRSWTKAGKGKDKVNEQQVQRVDQRSAETQSAMMTRDHGRRCQNEVQEQLSLRDAEISRLRRQNEELSVMLQQAKNLQGEDEQKEKEVLQIEIQVMEDKHQKLQKDYSKLQEDKKKVDEKAKELEEKIHGLLLKEKEQICSMDACIKKLLTEKNRFIDQSNQDNIRIRSLEDELLKNSRFASEINTNVESLKEQLSVKESELHRINDINKDLSATLLTTEEKLVEATKELQTRETAWKAERNTVEQLRKDVALREQEKEEMLEKQKETDDSNKLLQEKLRECEDKNKELLSVKESELLRITDVNSDLSAKLLSAEKKLVEANTELQTRETAWKAERNTVEQLRKDLARRDQEKQDFLKKQQETDDSNKLLQDKLREFEEKNQELQKLSTAQTST
nr:PREDICTED: intracellular protein transport protein USO1-like [Stegastes partitus]